MGAVLVATEGSVRTSFGIFFKPLAASFDWSRGATSGIQSALLIASAASGIAWGWLADRFGPARMLAFSGVLIGLGLVLTSQVSALWQIYLTYSLMTGIGIGSVYSIAATTAGRWFVKRRGLALGIVSAGIGLGNLVTPPAVTYLISTSGWSNTYLALGVIACAVILVGSILLRGKPEEVGLRPDGAPLTGLGIDRPGPEHGNRETPVPLRTVYRSKTLWMLLGIFFLFTLCNQLVIVHLVNYATDLKIDPLIAATFIGAVGISSVAGRLLMGSASDRIGNLNALTLSALGVAPSLIWLIFASQVWMFYVFAAVYGFVYGAEVPQVAALMGKYFGLRVVLIGTAQAGAGLGGALGSWMGGAIFDLTQSYRVAFIIGAAGIVGALMLALMLRRRSHI